MATITHTSETQMINDRAREFVQVSHELLPFVKFSTGIFVVKWRYVVSKEGVAN